MENNEQEEIIKIENASKPEDVLDTRSPQEIEAELIQKAEEASLEALSKMSPEKFAEQFFRMFYPVYRDKVHGLMAKGAKEALDALVLYPLENEGMVFSSKAAEAAFSLGTRLLDAKFIILQAAQVDRKIEVDNQSNKTVETGLPEGMTVETKFEQGEEVNE